MLCGNDRFWKDRDTMARQAEALRRSARAGLRRIQGKKISGAGRDYYDYNLLAAVILLTCFGLVMLYSTSAYEAAQNYNGNDTFNYNDKYWTRCI